MNAELQLSYNFNINQAKSNIQTKFMLHNTESLHENSNLEYMQTAVKVMQSVTVQIKETKLHNMKEF